MAENRSEEQTATLLDTLTTAFESGTIQNVRRMLNALHPAEIAHLLESLPYAEREIIWELVDSETDGDVLLELNDEVRASLVKRMNMAELVAATAGMDVDDLADFMQDLPNAVSNNLLRSMDLQDRQRLEAVLSYPEDSAGGMMNTDTVTVRPEVTLDVVLRYLRVRGSIPDQTDNLIVVNRKDSYLGVLSLADLLTSDQDLTVAEVMNGDFTALPANLSAVRVAQEFERRDFVSAPVVDEIGTLVGRITIDDVVDVIRDEAEHSIMSMAGLDEDEDMFAPVFASARRRALWLGINLVTAFLAAWFIGLFEATLEKVVALAVLMPIVASMGGIAGSQTLTLMIRGLALGQVERSNARSLLIKELAVGALNGVIWSCVVAGVAILWFGDWGIGLIIGIAIMLNLLCAAFAGVTIPMVLKRLDIDPALAGSVVLTTVTDIVGFCAFLGLATLLLL